MPLPDIERDNSRWRDPDEEAALRRARDEELRLADRLQMEMIRPPVRLPCHDNRRRDEFS